MSTTSRFKFRPTKRQWEIIKEWEGMSGFEMMDCDATCFSEMMKSNNRWMESMLADLSRIGQKEIEDDEYRQERKKERQALQIGGAS